MVSRLETETETTQVSVSVSRPKSRSALPGRELPDAFHDRLGQQLDSEKSKVYEEILQIEEYAAEHEMRLNVAKSKFMLFNPTENFDFTPKFEIDGNEIETM